jgi:hypothetical protein
LTEIGDAGQEPFVVYRALSDDTIWTRKTKHFFELVGDKPRFILVKEGSEEHILYWLVEVSSGIEPAVLDGPFFGWDALMSAARRYAVELPHLTLLAVYTTNGVPSFRAISVQDWGDMDI